MKKAFTLAELLIVLGTIGVVAALTMPTLIASYQKQVTVTQLKKAYSVLNQALMRSEVANGPMEYWKEGKTLGAEAYMTKYWLPYFEVVKLCKTPQQCGHDSNGPYYSLNGSKNSHTFSLSSYRIPFLTKDGMVYTIGVTSGNNYDPDASVWVDLNGARKPNTYGKDLFIFERVLGGKGILPKGYDKTDVEINSNCSKTGSGNYCAAKIIRAGWKIEADYPFGSK